LNIREHIRKKIDPEVLRVIETFGSVCQENNRRLVMVGGSVRDIIMDRAVFDVDLMADHPVQPLIQLLKNKLPLRVVSHPQFLTFSVFWDSKKVDIVTSREEAYPQAAQLPVVTPSAIEKDFKRRDFTINAIACWVSGGEMGDIYDPLSGYQDLKERREVKALHDQSFRDDPTRLFRAARFTSRFGFQVERNTQQWINKSLENGLLKLLSPVRRRHEFELLLKEENPVPAMELLKKWGALTFFYEGCDLSPDHKNDLKPLAKPDLAGRLVSWFKPLGRDKTEKILNELQFERERKKEILAHL